MKVSPRFSARNFIIFISICICISGTFGCGPSKKDVAKREANERKRQEYLTNLRQELRLRAEERLSSGEMSPKKVHDPGYEIVDCIRPELPEDFLGIEVGQRKFICGNTKAGSEIVTWRKWYCKGSEQVVNSRMSKCVICEWNNGEPSFDCELNFYKQIIGPPLVNGVLEYGPFHIE